MSVQIKLLCRLQEIVRLNPFSYLSVELSRFNSNIYIGYDLHKIHQQSWTISCFYVEQAATMYDELMMFQASSF